MKGKNKMKANKLNTTQAVAPVAPVNGNGLKDYLKNLVTANAEGGEVTLDEVQAKHPAIARRDIIQVLKIAPNGVFVVGRKGHTSRWVYGNAVNALPIKAPVQPVTRHYTRRTKNAPVATAQAYNLRVSIGGQTATVPFKMELVPAE